MAAAFPGMGKAYEDLIPGMRGFVVNDYLVFYVAVGGRIQVLRVINGYRDLRSVFEVDE
ncbi:MAG: type II toxin-antitoxin system RelE/ParE family toxin [Alkalinema sp. CAN_BIN05]|nr:type II toxin-antitoxin system RelE/ParE family toxin [Alkalinema sp. CAN_BIN05]